MVEVPTQGKLPIVGTAVTAWGDAFRSLAAMPVTAGAAFLLMLAVGGAALLLIPDVTRMLGRDSTWPHLVGMATTVVQSVLLAPLAIAVHRYVLLGEASQGYAIEPQRPRYLRFVGFSILIGLLFGLPNLIGSLLPGYGREEDITAAWGLVSAVLVVAIVIVTLRRAILFPAIAVDAPGASWSNARNDTKGHTWRVAFIFLCTVIPMMVLMVPLTFLMFAPPRFGDAGRIVFVVVSAGVQVVALSAFAAVASHLFKAYAARLTGSQVAATAVA